MSTTVRRSLTGIAALISAAAVAVTVATVAAPPAALATAPQATPTAVATAEPVPEPRAGAGLTTTAQAPDFDTFLADVVEDVAAYWSDRLTTWTPAYGSGEWQQLQYAILDEGESAESRCMAAADEPVVAGDPAELPGAEPAFFCPEDMTVYLSSPWLRTNIWSAGSSAESSDFGVAYVIAHEVAHAVQHDLGVTDPPTATTVAPTELQADCLAGVWSDEKYRLNQLDGSDIPEAVAAAASVGDYDFTDAGHHGTPDQRAAAFMVGYGSGSGDACTLQLYGAM
jgi:predicted metalloprotease